MLVSEIPVTRPGRSDLPQRAVTEAVRDSTNPSPEDSSPFALGLLLRRAHDQVAGVMDGALRPLGLERRHLIVLMRLADGPRTQRQLVDQTRHDKASMVRIVDDLEKLRFASRQAVAGG